MAPPRFKTRLILHGLAGACLFGAGWAFDTLPDLNLFWHSLGRPLRLAGLIFPFLAGFHRRPRFAALTTGISLSILAVTLLVAGGELAGRMIGFDFRRQQAAWQALPPYFRRPLTPMDGPFLRRPGPQTWTGQVIRAYVRHLGLPTAPYDAEPTITVRYDDRGFRNEPPQDDWSVAVAGDSFVELGHLPSDELFTTRLAARLGEPVLNLGVSHTGPLTHLAYLQAYGAAPGLRATVIVFYEGNDLGDLARERAMARRFGETGEPERLEFRPQTSLLRAIGEAWRRVRLARKGGPTAPPVYAHYRGRAGPIAVTLGPQPPDPKDFDPELEAAIETFLAEYAAFGRDRGVPTWLAFMPCKHRVLHGRLEFTEAAPAKVRDWVPTPLPDFLKQACAIHGIAFVDLTPPLIADRDAHGELGYNARYDLHLNRRGAAVVAEALAAALDPR